MTAHGLLISSSPQQCGIEIIGQNLLISTTTASFYITKKVKLLQYNNRIWLT